MSEIPEPSSDDRAQSIAGPVFKFFIDFRDEERKIGGVYDPFVTDPRCCSLLSVSGRSEELSPCRIPLPTTLPMDGTRSGITPAIPRGKKFSPEIECITARYPDRQHASKKLNYSKRPELLSITHNWVRV
jgi:hypothetical protein